MASSTIGKRQGEDSEDDEGLGLQQLPDARLKGFSKGQLLLAVFIGAILGAGGGFGGAKYMAEQALVKEPGCNGSTTLNDPPRAPQISKVSSTTLNNSPRAPQISKVNTSKQGPLKCGFAAYFANHSKGPGIHKWTHYFEVYEENFGPFCASGSASNRMRMMEIGIQSGGSMMMWRHAFGSKLEQLVGVDLNPNTKAWEKFGSNVKVEIGSQADPVFLDSLAAKYRDGIDVILDDGSHVPAHIILTFAKLWPLVRPGGVYMIEDLHGPNPVFDWLYFGFNSSQINWRGIMGAESKKGPVNGIRAGNFGFFNQWPPMSALQADVYSVNAYPYMISFRRRSQRLTSIIDPRHGTQWIPYGPR